LNSKTTSMETSVALAHQGKSPGRPLIDIRTEQERRVGVASDSIALSPEEVLSRSQDQSESGLKSAYIMCAGGVRSLALVQSLNEFGLTDFISVKGGYKAWCDAQLPSEHPVGFDAHSSQRYARHLVMPQVGPEGQLKLLKSRVLLVGMGGLNSPAALYLAAAGVGTMGLVDDDRIERSNLQRQIIHSDQKVGQSKVSSAKSRMLDLNPDVVIETFESRVSDDNALDFVKGWDLVVDGSDNFATRYALNRACLETGIPLVYGAVMRFQGQVSVFSAGQGSRPQACYRCLFPKAPSEDEAPNCAVAGVLGVMPGIVGTLQACEALKLLLGLGQPLVGRLLMIDALNMEFHETRMEANPQCPDCSRYHPSAS
jgi:molybdopterin/thiamine biosynthesis adenylyltransferase/rhodanese-related sulfurtransferase